jgi:hypothetical protein
MMQGQNVRKKFCNEVLQPWEHAISHLWIEIICMVEDYPLIVKSATCFS